MATYFDNTGVPYLDFCIEGFLSKYALKSDIPELNEILPRQALMRVANFLGQGPYTAFREAFRQTLGRGGVPAGRILANAGTPYQRASLINCTVSQNIGDSMDDIFTAVRNAALTLSSGAGIGYCFSTLRPAGAPVSGVGSISSGPISFMHVFSATCQTVFSGGGRRGAQMGTFWVYHPDIFDFISVKANQGALRNMNLSVLVDDAFMEAVFQDKEVPLYFPALSNDPPGSEYAYLHMPGFGSYMEEDSSPRKVKCRIYRRVRAREIWDAIMKHAYRASEPGVLFYDRINRNNPLNYKESIIATNPCGEQCLPPNGACNLGSMNLVAYIHNKENHYTFDWTTFQADAVIMHVLLDAVCDHSRLPIEEQRREILAKRRHGLGIMGLGSALALLELPYTIDHEGTREFCKGVMERIVVAGLYANNLLAAKIKHCPAVGPSDVKEYFNTPYWQNVRSMIDIDSYMKFNPSIKPTIRPIPKCLRDVFGLMCPFACDDLPPFEEVGVRFTHATAIAPTGTIAMYIGNNISTGIEPTFLQRYIRNIKVPGKACLVDAEVSSYEYRRFRRDFPHTPFPKSFVSARDVPVKDHLGVQGFFQKYIDASISKTINVPSETSFEDFKDIYRIAYESGCKGCTTFRFNPEIFHGVLVNPDDLEQSTYILKMKDGSTQILHGNDRVFIRDTNEDVLVANLAAYFHSET
jgi:ribonucleoside-diphosphate reductase alpha chain